MGSIGERKKKDGLGKSKEGEERRRKGKKGHNGRKKMKEKVRRRKVDWCLVTQRSAEGLMGTNKPLLQCQQY